MARPKTVYKGKRKFGKLITVLACTVVILIILAIWLFYHLQKYIVYDKDGLSLQIPFLQGQTMPAQDEPEPEAEAVTFLPEEAEIVISAPDLSNVSTTAGENLSELRARYVNAADISGTSLVVSAAGASALVLQLKAADGLLAYKSSVSLADDYGVNAAADIAQTVQELRESGVYLVAELSCLIDNTMAERNSPIALKSAAQGAPVSDSRGSFIDPYSSTARGYITDLIKELSQMGFDEVLLTNVIHPERTDVVYSQNMSQTLDKVSCISLFAKYVSDAAREAGIHVSVLCSAANLRTNSSAEIGQDIEFFFAVFDRVYVDTNSDYYLADLSTLEAFLGSASDTRIVPMIAGYIPEDGSFVAK